MEFNNLRDEEFSSLNGRDETSGQTGSFQFTSIASQNGSEKSNSSWH